MARDVSGLEDMVEVLRVLVNILPVYCLAAGRLRFWSIRAERWDSKTIKVRRHRYDRDSPFAHDLEHELKDVGQCSCTTSHLKLTLMWGI